MLASAPVSIPQYTPVNNLDSYLRQVDRALSHFDLNLDNHHASSFTQLKQTLVDLEVAHIKHTAIQQGIWDFYPTTQLVIDKMMAIAHLQKNHYVLEPSAGTGDLVTAIALSGVNNLDCFEIHPLLQQALKLQDFNLIGANFLASTPQPVYARILTNPPFSNNGVARHTQHAYLFLKPGGKLVTLAHHYNLKPSPSDRSFFAWLKDNQARFLNLGQAFKNGDRKTNVPLQLIVINKL